MADATILIPTHRHASLLPLSLASALAQRGVAVEVFVVGDGVDDESRQALESFLGDERVRFFDRPKGPGRGERHRHAALEEATAPFICYLSDDDLLLPEHVVEMRALLADADFAHSAPVIVGTDGSLSYLPVDLTLPDYRDLLLSGRWNAISLTGAAHTLEAYRRLPYGWREAPRGVWSDLHMWQQFAALPEFRGRTATRLTHLHLADADRRHFTEVERAAELERWSVRIQLPSFERELDLEVASAIRAAANRKELRLRRLEASVRSIQATRLWRFRTWTASLPPVRWAKPGASELSDPGFWRRG